jgi:hypothetical protein
VEGRWAPPLVQRGHDEGVVLVRRCEELYPRTRRRCHDRPSLRRTVSAHLCTSFQGIPEGSGKPDDGGNVAERYGQTGSTLAPPTSAYGHGVVSSARTFGIIHRCRLQQQQQHLCRTSSRTTKSSEEIGATTLECPLLAVIRQRETLKIIRPMVEANPELLLPSKMGGPAAEAEAARAKAKSVPALHYACVGAQTLALSGTVSSSVPNRPASGGGILPRTTTTPNAAGDPEASDERTNRA